METKSLEQILRENKERTQRRIIERKRNKRKEELKDAILLSIIIGFIVFATATLLSHMNNDHMERCTNAGHSTSYCERGL